MSHISEHTNGSSTQGTTVAPLSSLNPSPDVTPSANTGNGTVTPSATVRQSEINQADLHGLWDKRRAAAVLATEGNDAYSDLYDPTMNKRKDIYPDDNDSKEVMRNRWNPGTYARLSSGISAPGDEKHKPYFEASRAHNANVISLFKSLNQANQVIPKAYGGTMDLEWPCSNLDWAYKFADESCPTKYSSEDLDTAHW
ncbi:hypothetical protein IAR55_001509 [Kwoniella newhampshirensis]|uniref:SCP domain-containing protein n=1 Tax=Kwoniella newhampshirensis TaxID=1651941 RepID=A0AAW0Z2C7_9TREE